MQSNRCDRGRAFPKRGAPADLDPSKLSRLCPPARAEGRCRPAVPHFSFAPVSQIPARPGLRRSARWRCQETGREPGQNKAPSAAVAAVPSYPAPISLRHRYLVEGTLSFVAGGTVSRAIAKESGAAEMTRSARCKSFVFDQQIFLIGSGGRSRVRKKIYTNQIFKVSVGRHGVPNSAILVY